MAAGPSLANKVQVLFGTSLLLIVAGTLAIPWVMTDRLVFQSQSEVSRQLADAWLDSPTKLAIGGTLPIRVEDVDAIDENGRLQEEVKRQIDENGRLQKNVKLQKREKKKLRKRHKRKVEQLEKQLGQLEKQLKRQRQ